MTFERSSVAIVVLFGLWLGTGCYQYDPLFCETDRDCADLPDRPVCDQHGSSPASNHVARTCIPVPDAGGPDPAEGTVVVTWNLYSGDRVADCPANTKALVHALREGGPASGDAVFTFDCSEGLGITGRLAAGRYAIDVEVFDEVDD